MDTTQHNEMEFWETAAKSLYDERGETNEHKPVPADKNENAKIVKMAHRVNLFFDLRKYKAEPAWEKVWERSQGVSAPSVADKKLINNKLYWIAAAILAAALLFAGVNFFRNSMPPNMLQATTTDKVLNSLVLPDGSKVSLNTNSQITYPEQFSSKTREVNIEGEAFFEVTPDKHKPFIINAGKAQVKVLGTSFNVSAYPNNQQVEIIVAAGKVEISQKESKAIQTDGLTLASGEKGTLAYYNNTLHKTTNNDPNFMAWKTRDLIFKATTLSKVIADLEKVYKVKILLDNPKMNELLLTARFNNYSLDFILKVIADTFNFDVQKADGQFVLKETRNAKKNR